METHRLKVTLLKNFLHSQELAWFDFAEPRTFYVNIPREDLGVWAEVQIKIEITETKKQANLGSKERVVERLNRAIGEIETLIELIRNQPSEFDFHQLWHCFNELELAGGMVEEVWGGASETEGE